MIRKAQKDDLSPCVELLLCALDEVAFCLSQTRDLAATKQILGEMFLSTQCRISYQNCSVFEIDGEVAGLMVAYDGANLAWLDFKFKNVFERECFDDEFYVDALAVFKKHQKKGIATQLLAHASTLGKERKKDKVALVVQKNKQKNINLYQKLGFKTDKILQIYNDEYLHMTKEIR